MALIKMRCVMKSYDELKAEMEIVQQQMVEAKKSERTVALKKVKELGFTTGMLRGAIAEGLTKR